MDWSAVKDAVWNWFVFWGPIARDLLSILLAAIGAALAWLAIRMGRKQEKLSVELAAIEKRQGEIVESQHRFHLEQLAKSARLVLKPSSQSKEGLLEVGGVSHGHGLLESMVQVFNQGNKTATGFYWEILVQKELWKRVEFKDLRNEDVEPDWVPLSGERHYDRVKGHHPHMLFPRTHIDIIKLWIKPNAPDRFELLWRVHYEDGQTPESGYRRLEFIKQSTEFYHASDKGETVAS